MALSEDETNKLNKIIGKVEQARKSDNLRDFTEAVGGDLDVVQAMGSEAVEFFLSHFNLRTSPGFVRRDRIKEN